jgi:hypothetical protein
MQDHIRNHTGRKGNGSEEAAEGLLDRSYLQ